MFHCPCLLHKLTTIKKRSKSPFYQIEFSLLSLNKDLEISKLHKTHKYNVRFFFQYPVFVHSIYQKSKNNVLVKAASGLWSCRDVFPGAAADSYSQGCTADSPAYEHWYKTSFVLFFNKSRQHWLYCLYHQWFKTCLNSFLYEDPSCCLACTSQRNWRRAIHAHLWQQALVSLQILFPSNVICWVTC